MKTSIPLPASKLPEVGTTIFTKMSALALKHGALNVAQGFPDLDPPFLLRESVKKAIDDGVNQYAPMAGDPKLRSWIAKMYREKHGIDYHVDDEITIGAGASSVLFASIQALVHPGDEVIIIDPSYDLYAPAVHLAGGRIVRAPIPKSPDQGGTGGALNPHEIGKLLTHRTRLVIINAPHNPTGACFTTELLEELSQVLKNTSAFLLSDEVYGPMVHDGRPEISVAGVESLASRSLVFGSFGKLFHATGWKIGWVVAPSDITRELRKVHQYDVFSTGAPIQRGLANYLTTKDSEEHLQQLGPIYAAKRDKLLKGLEGTSFKFSPAEGGYFQIIGYSNLDNRPDCIVANEWTEQHGLATIPISPFRSTGSKEAENERRLRICFAKGDNTIEKTIDRLIEISNHYSNN